MKSLKKTGSIFILCAISVAASIITAWQLMQIYATVTLPVEYCILGAVCGTLIAIAMYIIKCKCKLIWHIPARIAIIAGLALAVWLKFDEIAGGMAYIVNFSIDELNEYYGVGMYYVYITEGMLEHADQTLFAYIACGMAGYGYMSVFLNGKGVAAASLLAVFSYVYPATLEAGPSEWILLGVMSLVVCMIIQGERARSGCTGAKRTSVMYAGLPLLVLAIGISAIYMAAVPAKDYEVPGLFNSMKGKLFFSAKDVQLAIDGYRGTADSSNASVGTGIIGKVDTVSYSDEPVFKIKAPKKGGIIYLKAFQAADYTKRRWKEIGESTYIENRAMFDAMSSAGKTPLLAGYRAVSELTGMGAVGIGSVAYDIDITWYSGDGNSYVPASAVQADGKPLDELADADKAVVLEGDDSGADNITHSYRLVEWRNFSSLYKLVVNGGVLADADDAYTRFVYEHYLGTDEACDDRIKRELFPKIMSSDYSLDTTAGRAMFIMDVMDYLAGNYEYTLAPGTTPSGKDYVEYFLFEKKKGLCTHFASSAAMILRSAGIPTRYVEGYVVPESLYPGNPVSASGVSIRGNGEFYKDTWDYYEVTVTDRYAHAWIEVYIDGIGWITVDATPGYAEQYLRGQDEYTGRGGTQGDENAAGESTEETEGESADESITEGAENPSETEKTGNSEEPTVETAQEQGTLIDGNGNDATDGRNVESVAASEKEKADGISFGDIMRKAGDILKPVFAVMWFILKLVLLPLIVALLLLIRQKYMEQKRGKLYNKECGLLPDERIRRIMNYHARLLRYVKAVDVKSMTMAEISATVFGDIDGAEEAFGIVDKAMYSYRQPSEDEVMQVMAYVDNVRGMVYCRLGFTKKFIFKYILVL